jgi:hypothetical protein
LRDKSGRHGNSATGHLFAPFMDHVAADLYTTDTNKIDKEIDTADFAIKCNLTQMLYKYPIGEWHEEDREFYLSKI